MSAVEFGTVKTQPGRPVSQCLARLHDGLTGLIDRTSPEAVAIEGIFYCRNVKTAVTLGEARGVAIAACASRGLPVYEYAPRRVKQAVVGFGGAAKEQIRAMVARLLGLPEEPGEDAADALALAICHLHSRTGYAALQSKAI